MKITLEPTKRKNLPYESPTVVITMPSDELTLDEVLESLVRPALIGYGFSVGPLYEDEMEKGINVMREQLETEEDLDELE